MPGVPFSWSLPNTAHVARRRKPEKAVLRSGGHDEFITDPQCVMRVRQLVDSTVRDDTAFVEEKQLSAGPVVAAAAEEARYRRLAAVNRETGGGKPIHPLHAAIPKNEGATPCIAVTEPGGDDVAGRSSCGFADVSHRW